MRAPLHRLMLLAGLLMAVLLIAPLNAAVQDDTVHAQPAPQSGSTPMPMYDKAAEASFSGVVEEVIEMNHGAMMGRGAGRGAGRGMMRPNMPMAMGMTGIHLKLRTDKDVLDVHLGPKTFLTDRQLTLAQGDRLDIIGARATMNGEPIVIARQVTKGGTTVNLRDEAGKPLWAGASR